MNPHHTKSSSIFVWLALATGLALSGPFIAMQFTEEVNWGIADFILMGALLFGAGSLFVVMSRKMPRKYRFVIGLLLAVAIVFIWAELAVGIFTEWGS